MNCVININNTAAACTVLGRSPPENTGTSFGSGSWHRNPRSASRGKTSPQTRLGRQTTPSPTGRLSRLSPTTTFFFLENGDLFAFREASPVPPDLCSCGRDCPKTESDCFLVPLLVHCTVLSCPSDSSVSFEAENFVGCAHSHRHSKFSSSRDVGTGAAYS